MEVDNNNISLQVNITIELFDYIATIIENNQLLKNKQQFINFCAF